MWQRIALPYVHLYGFYDPVPYDDGIDYQQGIDDEDEVLMMMMMMAVMINPKRVWRRRSMVTKKWMTENRK